MNQILKSLLKPQNPWEGMYGETPDASDNEADGAQ